MIHKLALGTVQFGLNYGVSNQRGQTTKEEVARILDTACQHGISVLDTAQAYGSSEEVLGYLHNGRFEIVTKIQPGLNGVSVSMLIQKSLKRLNVRCLYGVLFHGAECVLSNPKCFHELLSMKKDGHVRKIGFSVYTPQELNCLIETFGIPDLVQVPFSHLDRRFEDILVDLHSVGVEIHTRSTFLQGLFFIDPNGIDVFFEPISLYLMKLKNVFPDNDKLAGFLLSYVASRSFVDKVVVGVNNLRQLQSNISFLAANDECLELDFPEVPDKILIPSLWETS